MDKNFGEEYQEIKNTLLLKLNSVFFDHQMEEIAESFQSSLKEACGRVRSLQETGFQRVEYLEFTLLRTRLLEHDFRAPIMAYGEDWYADVNQAQAGEIDTTDIFSYYEELIEAVKGLVKKYRTKLPEQMVTECMCSAAEYFWKYVAIALRRAVMGFSADQFNITEDFRIRCCEYMGYGEVLWRFTPELSAEQMKKWFDKREKDVYRFRDFRGRNFSGWDFSGLDLNGCDFRNCDLTGCNFESADLTGAWFCESDMRDACLNGVWMPGARLDRADLTGASLCGAYCTCKISRSLWMRPDNVCPSFAGAVLQNADLTFSAMEGADFSGADLKGALFSDSHRNYYALEDGQIAQALFEEGLDEDQWEALQGEE